MRIYMDVCCLNRPFDDQSQDRIQLEAGAITKILLKCLFGKWSLVSSDAVNFEISKNADMDKIQKILNLLNVVKEHIYLTENITKRAMELENIGFKRFDSFHIAYAEEAKVDVLLTTDDRFEKRANREDVKLQISVVNPLKWLLEIGEK